jgi:hypothetical protein
MSHFYSAHAYQAFEGLFILVEKALANVSISVACGCQPGVVRQRLIQRLVEYLQRLYLVLVFGYVKQDAPPR